ncbi:phage terminase large subunit, partial [Acinetobacter baumannii]
FRSAEDPDKLRGPNLSGSWLDEASLMEREAFDICIASLREAGEQGWLSATFTPRGLTHWTYDLFGRGGRPDVELFTSRTRDNPFAPVG